MYKRQANIQSGIKVTKSYRQYFTSSWRYLFPHNGHGALDAGIFLKSEDADIALLTEVDAGSRRSRGVSQLEVMGRETDLENGQFFPTRSVGSSINEGNAVLTRFPISTYRSHVLHSTVNPRVLGETVLDIGDRTLTVLVAHLALGSKPRAVQLAQIAKRVTEIKGPLMLGGDFNERDHRSFELLERAGLAPVSVPGYPSWKPLHALQVLFLSHHFTLESASVPVGAPFSDHLPLIVEAMLSYVV